MIAYLLEASLILATLTGGYGLLLRRSPRFALHRWLLWLNLVVSVTLPLVELPDLRPEPVRQLVRTRLADMPRFSAALARKPAAEPVSPEVPAPVPAETQTVDWMALMGWFYGVGVAVLASGLLLQLGSLYRLISRSEPRETDGIHWLHNPNVAGPFSFFGWIVLDESRYTPDERWHILLHEFIHYRQGHSVDRLAAEWLRIVFWFNPLAWWQGRLVEENLEYLVDQEVLEDGIDRKAYQYTLLKVGTGIEPAWLTNSFGTVGLLRRRFARMSQDQASQGGLWRYGLVTILLVLITWACSKPEETSAEGYVSSRKPVTRLPPTNPSRQLLHRWSDDDLWVHQQLIRTRQGYEYVYHDFSSLYLIAQNGRLGLKNPPESLSLWIDGVPKPLSEIPKLSLDQVDEVFLVVGWKQEAYHRMLIQTRVAPSSPPLSDKGRQDYFRVLEALAVTDHPGGRANTFSMNGLLEATFFERKDALVKRTRKQHLALYEEVKDAITVFIDGMEVQPDAVEQLHIREVKTLYANERPIEAWVPDLNPNQRPGDPPLTRYVLYIEREPKRAVRDSSYYVFSPFYSGDF